MTKIETLIVNAEQNFLILKQTKWWVRAFDMIYKLEIVVFIGFNATDILTDSIDYVLFDIFYTFIAISTIVLVIVSTYHILVWLCLYIGFGQKLFQENNTRIHNLYVFNVFVYLIIFSTVWAFLGS